MRATRLTLSAALLLALTLACGGDWPPPPRATPAPPHAEQPQVEVGGGPTAALAPDGPQEVTRALHVTRSRAGRVVECIAIEATFLPPATLAGDWQAPSLEPLEGTTAIDEACDDRFGARALAQCVTNEEHVLDDGTVVERRLEVTHLDAAAVLESEARRACSGLWWAQPPNSTLVRDALRQ